MKIDGLQGDWWIAADPECKAPGRLTFNPTDGGSIEAWGPRLGAPLGTESFTANQNAPVYFDRIFGTTEQGNITLLNCRIQQSSYSLGSTNTKQIITCSTIIKNIHASDDHEFNRARVEIVNLDEWTSLVTIRPDGHNGFSVSHPPGHTMTLQSGVTLHLSASTSSGMDRRSAQINIHNQLFFTFNDSIKYEDILTTWIRPFVDLLTLATFRPSAIEKLELSDCTADASWYEVGIRHGFDPAKRISFWASQPVLRFSDLDVDHHIPRWYEMAHRLQGIFNYVFGARYFPDLLPENQYLNATTAAEAIHRELIDPTRREINLDDPVVQAFVVSFPEEERKLLTDRLMNLNDASFHERLNYLYQTTRPFSERLAPNGKKWITAVKKARNALTHQKGTLSKVPSSDKLAILGESLFLVISVFILTELGFSAQDVNVWLDREGRTRFIIQYLHASFPELGVS